MAGLWGQEYITGQHTKTSLIYNDLTGKSTTMPVHQNKLLMYNIAKKAQISWDTIR